MNVCVACGGDYEYDSNNPLGASSERCSSCRKKDTKLNNKIKLFEIAGDRCVKCGYHGSIHSLALVNAIEPISKPTNQEQLEKQAKKQFVLCLNCKAEIDHKVYEMKVTSTAPIKVEFYYREVKVVLTPYKNYQHQEDNGVEIVTDTPPVLKKV